MGYWVCKRYGYVHQRFYTKTQADSHEWRNPGHVVEYVPSKEEAGSHPIDREGPSRGGGGRHLGGTNFDGVIDGGGPVPANNMNFEGVVDGGGAVQASTSAGYNSDPYQEIDSIPAGALPTQSTGSDSISSGSHTTTQGVNGGSSGGSGGSVGGVADTRTQEEKEAQYYAAVSAAEQKAAQGNNQDLRNLNAFFNWGWATNDARFSRHYYADLSQTGLSDAKQKEIKDWFIQHDTNNDGVISSSEMPGYAVAPNANYVGADRSLSMSESVQYHLDRDYGIDGMLAGSGLPPEVNKEIKDWFIQHDTNRDGKISSSEMPGYAVAPNANYVGADGQLSVRESINYHRDRLGLGPLPTEGAPIGVTIPTTSVPPPPPSVVAAPDVVAPNPPSTFVPQIQEDPDNPLPNSSDDDETNALVEPSDSNTPGSVVAPTFDADADPNESNVVQNNQLSDQDTVDVDNNPTSLDVDSAGNQSEGQAESQSNSNAESGDQSAPDNQDPLANEQIDRGGDVPREKDEEVQSSLAARKSKDEDRLRKIMKQRERWGGASASASADSLAAPVVTPASNLPNTGVPKQR